MTGSFSIQPAGDRPVIVRDGVPGEHKKYGVPVAGSF